MRRSKGYTDELEKINHDDMVCSNYQFKRSCRKKTKIQNYRVFSSRILVLIIKQGLYYVIPKLQYFLSRFIFKMFRKYTSTENYYKITKKNYIMSYKKFNIEKPDDLYKKKKK